MMPQTKLIKYTCQKEDKDNIYLSSFIKKCTQPITKEEKHAPKEVISFERKYGKEKPDYIIYA